MGFESMDVDARVWNKELGYFEYPSEQQSTKSASSQQRSAVASAPIAIQSSKKTQHKSHNTQSDGNGSYGSASRMLLTPAMMLSSSCPDATSLSNDRDPVQQQPTGRKEDMRLVSLWFASLCALKVENGVLFSAFLFLLNCLRLECEYTKQFGEASIQARQEPIEHTCSTAKQQQTGYRRRQWRRATSQWERQQDVVD